MKSQRFIEFIKAGLLLILFSLSILFYCAEKKEPLTSGQDLDEMNFDRDLVPAEEGPERSAFGVPAIEIDRFRVQVTGLVDSSFSLSWEEIQKLSAAYTDTLIMYCVEGWQVWGVWKGMLIGDLLDKTGVRADAEYILFECADGYKSVLPVSFLKKYGAMLAYQVNDSLLQEHDGFPLPLIAPGIYGYKWSKWVNRMDVMNVSMVYDRKLEEYLDPAHVPLERRRYFEGQDAKPLDY